jgi:hypothetical protein
MPVAALVGALLFLLLKINPCFAEVNCVSLGTPLLERHLTYRVRVMNNCSSAVVHLTLQLIDRRSIGQISFTEEYTNLIVGRELGFGLAPSDPSRDWDFRFTLPSTFDGATPTVEISTVVLEDGEAFGLAETIEAVREEWKGRLEAARRIDNTLAAANVSADPIGTTEQVVNTLKALSSGLRQKKGGNGRGSTKLNHTEAAFLRGFTLELDGFSEVYRRTPSPIQLRFVKQKIVLFDRLVTLTPRQ